MFFKITTLITFLLSLLTALAAWHQWQYWAADIASHFILQYSVIAAVLTLYFLVKRRFALFLLAFILLLVNGFRLAPFLLPVMPPPVVASVQVAKPVLKIYHANVWYHNSSISQVIDQINQLHPDLISLIEVTPEHFLELRPLYSSYPYQFEYPFSKVGGYIFLSKYPLRQNRVHLEKQYSFIPLYQFEILWQNQRIDFFAVHSANPLKWPEFNDRNRHFFWMAEILRASTLPLIFLGDFNATPYAAIYDDFVSAANLVSTSKQFGWTPTWNPFLPFLYIPIDHLFLSEGVQAVTKRVLPRVHSDHLPLYLEVQI